MFEITGGSEFIEVALAQIFLAMFLVGSYRWMAFGAGEVSGQPSEVRITMGKPRE